MAEQIVDTYKGPFWRSNGAIFIVIKSFLGRRLLDVNMRSFMESPRSRWVTEMGMRYPTQLWQEMISGAGIFSPSCLPYPADKRVI